MHKYGTITESDIFADLIAADRGDLTPEVARAVLRWRFTRQARTHMTRLATRADKGTITDAERDELDRYVRVGTCVNVLQAKARLSLKTALATEA